MLKFVVENKRQPEPGNPGEMKTEKTMGKVMQYHRSPESYGIAIQNKFVLNNCFKQSKFSRYAEQTFPSLYGTTLTIYFMHNQFAFPLEIRKWPLQ